MLLGRLGERVPMGQAGRILPLGLLTYHPSPTPTPSVLSCCAPGTPLPFLAEQLYGSY